MKLLDASAVAAMLSVSRSTVYKCAARGQLPESVKIGRRVRWRETDILEMINGENRVETNMPSKTLTRKEENDFAALIHEFGGGTVVAITEEQRAEMVSKGPNYIGQWRGVDLYRAQPEPVSAMQMLERLVNSVLGTASKAQIEAFAATSRFMPDDAAIQAATEAIGALPAEERFDALIKLFDREERVPASTSPFNPENKRQMCLFYDLQTASEEGDNRHPQIVIRELAKSLGFTVLYSLPQSIVCGWDFWIEAESPEALALPAMLTPHPWKPVGQT